MPSLSSRADYGSLKDCIYLNQASLGLIGRPAVAAIGTMGDLRGDLRGNLAQPLASGSETRVWGYSDADDPTILVARAMPDEVRAMLSVDKTVDVTV